MIVQIWILGGQIVALTVALLAAVIVVMVCPRTGSYIGTIA